MPGRQVSSIPFGITLYRSAPGGPSDKSVTCPEPVEVAGLTRYLYGPGERNEHVDPHVVAGFRHPAALEPAIRPDGVRDLSKLNRLLSQPLSALPSSAVDATRTANGRGSRRSRLPQPAPRRHATTGHQPRRTRACPHRCPAVQRPTPLKRHSMTRTLHCSGRDPPCMRHERVSMTVLRESHR